MNLTVQLNEKLTATLDVSHQRDAFEELSRVQEVFGNTQCKKCNGTDVRYQVRTDHEENKYYELVCNSCRAKLAFGAHKKGGGLFPKRKDKEGNWLNTNGWVKWNKDTQKEE